MAAASHVDQRAGRGPRQKHRAHPHHGRNRHGRGDYWNTNYPQPTILTSRWLAAHLDGTSYSVVDCSDPARHTFEVWADSARFELFAAPDAQALVGQLSTRFGRPARAA
jgi:hypothetical protein